MRVTPSERDRAYESAKCAYREHRYEESLALLDDVDAQDENRFVYARARCLIKLGRRLEALEACSRLTREFHDPRGQRLVEKIQETMPVQSSPPPSRQDAEPVAGRRWIWASASVLAILGAAVGVAAYAYIGHHASAPVVDEAISTNIKETPVATKPEPKAEPSPIYHAKDLLRLNGIDRIFERENAKSDTVEDMPQGRHDIQLASYTSTGKQQPRATAGLFDGPDEIVRLTQVAQAQTPPPAPATIEPKLVDNVLGLQSFKTEQRLSNARGDTVVLTNLNPYVGAWYLIDVTIGGEKNILHLEVPALRGDPMKRPKLSLCRDGLVFSAEGKSPIAYPLWSSQAQATTVTASDELCAQPVMPEAFKPGHAFTSAFNVICDGMLLIRSQKAGVATRLESATDLLRETSIGSWFVEKAKPYLIPEPEMGDDGHGTAAAQAQHSETYPLDAQVDESQLTLFGSPQRLGIECDAPDRKLYYGRWYKAVKHPHVFVSMMKPTLADKSIMESYTDRVGVIGSRDRKRHEAEALVYLVAYDLRYFRFGYALGADHPKLDWSPRAVHTGTEKGPDGFDSRKPLCTIGALPPYYSPYIAATFTGGFKREHGAFKEGPYSQINSGSHFGFMEQGTVFSTLKPGLATIVVGLDGSFNMVTWPNETPSWFTKLAHARQNCVPLIEGHDGNGLSIPGKLVNDWGAGSWSGDQAGDFVTLRGSAAMQEFNGPQGTANRFLLFAYFTGATPNAMARTFQAYHCSYAMLLDMNTPNYCFTALYTHDADGKVNGVEYLHKDMAANNGDVGDLKFLQRNDTRDFFYALRIPERP